VEGALQGFDAVTGFEFGCFSQRSDALNHGLAIDYTGDKMCGERSSFAPAPAREFCKERVSEGARDFGKCVAIEKKERRLAMKRTKPV